MNVPFKKKSKDLILEENTQIAQDAQYEVAPSDTEVTALVKAKIPLSHHTWAKFVAFLLVIVMSLVAVCSTVGAIFMIEEEFYTTPEWTVKEGAMQDIAKYDLLMLIQYITDVDQEAGEGLALHYLSERNIAFVEMSFSDGSRGKWTYDTGEKASPIELGGTWYHIKHKGTSDNWYTPHWMEGENYLLLGTVEATIYLTEEYTEQDGYFFVDRLISLVYALRYWVYGIGILAVIIAIASFVFLMCASGRKNGLPTAQPGWGTKIPFDLLTGMTAFAGFLMIKFTEEGPYYGSDIITILAYIALAIALKVIAVG